MFCPNCGAQVPDNAHFCGNCGAQIGAAAQAPAGGQPSAAQGQAYQQQYQQPYQQPYQQANQQQYQQPYASAGYGYAQPAQRASLNNTQIAYIVIAVVLALLALVAPLYSLKNNNYADIANSFFDLPKSGSIVVYANFIADICDYNDLSLFSSDFMFFVIAIAVMVAGIVFMVLFIRSLFVPSGKQRLFGILGYGGMALGELLGIVFLLIEQSTEGSEAFAGVSIFAWIALVLAVLAVVYFVMEQKKNPQAFAPAGAAPAYGAAVGGVAGAPTGAAPANPVAGAPASGPENPSGQQ